MIVLGIGTLLIALSIAALAGVYVGWKWRGRAIK